MMKRDDNKNQKVARVSPWAGVVFLGVIAGLCWGGYAGFQYWSSQELAQKQIVYETRLQEAQDALEEVERQEAQMLAEASDSNAARIERDGVIIDNMLSETLIWMDFEGYSDARKTAMEHYGIAEDSRFMAVYLPEIHETPETADGSTYNYIDVNGINVHYEGKNLHLCEIEGDVYRYFAEVTTSSMDRHGNEGFSKSVFLCSVNGDGKITDVDAYTLLD